VATIGSDAGFTRRSPLLEDACRFASQAHAGQRDESDGGPYIRHPLAVARLVYEAGYSDDVVAAALLHDTVEDTEVTEAQIRARFGAHVADLVAAATEPAEIEPYEARKEAHRRQVVAAGHEAEAIFAADKVINAANLRAAIAEHGSSELRKHLSRPLEKKIEHYRATLELLEAAASTVPFLDELHSELDELDEQRTHERAREEVARRAVAAINVRDADALVALCHPDVEWWPALTLRVGGIPYRGHDGIRRYIADLRDAWDEFDIEIQELRPIRDRVLALCDLRVRGRVSGASLEQQAAVVYWVRGDRVGGARTYLDPAQPPERDPG